MLRRRLALASAPVALALGFSASAGAIHHHSDGPTDANVYPENPHDDPVLLIFADDGVSDIAVGLDASPATYSIQDRANRVASTTCERTDRDDVSCPSPAAEPRFVTITLRLGAGDDAANFRIHGSTGYRSSKILGGIGDNRLFGGGSDDSMRGTPYGGSNVLVGRGGNDVLRGGYREDRLSGGDGDDYLIGRGKLDVLDAGSGDDTVIASDGVREPELSCGPGDDRAVIDRRDPKPDDCEEIEVIPPGGGVPH